MFKRWLSACLTAALLASCLPAAAAGEPEQTKDLSQFVVENKLKQPSGITVNVFDYWTSDNRVDQEDKDDRAEEVDETTDDPSTNTGINNNHILKFFYGTKFTRLMNLWTGGDNGDGGPRTGIVAKKLDSDGFPVLTNDEKLGTNGESLAYLFNDKDSELSGNDKVPGKKAFLDVEGLFRVDKEGYYYYNASQNAVKSDTNPSDGYASANFAVLDERDPDNYHFDLYDSPGVKEQGSYNGEFFPFANPNDVFTVEDGKLTQTNIVRDSSKLNHFFGMHMTTRFLHRNDGKTPDGKTTTFEFAGDDDVWIFIDRVLVADLGGIHDSASVKINFGNGTVTINGEAAQSLGDSFGWGEEQQTFPNNTYHTLDFFYLERGYYDSNMSMKFNLSYIPESTIEKVDQFGTGVNTAKFQLSAVKSDNGNVPGPSNGVLATGTTDDKGHLALYDDNGAPLSLDELHYRKVNTLLLSEIETLPGYRPLSEIPLQLINLAEGSANHSLTALFSQDPWGTGVFSSGKVTATVNNTFHYGLGDKL